MNIGLIKEIKKDENRVALQPKHINVLTKNGHNVFIEHYAGKKSGYIDSEYQNYGAIICNKKKILETCTLLLKVKAPLEEEYNDYNKSHTLFTYLHFDENIKPEKINRLIKSGFLGIAYEWVKANGDYPLLRPMSKLTGYLFAQKSVELLTKHKGKLCGGYEDYLTSANILIIGLGTIGMSACKYCMVNNLKITIVDKHKETINERLNIRFKTNNIDYLNQYNIKVIQFENDNPENTKKEIDKNISNFDIILNCAVRRPDMPKSKLEYIIDRQMVKKMQANSVICDTTGCDKDLIETCISTELLDHVDIVDNVVHYNCEHIPSLVGNTATNLLTDNTFPYILEIANKGVMKALTENDALNSGASCYKGKITHKYSAQKKNLQYYNINDLINE